MKNKNTKLNKVAQEHNWTRSVIAQHQLDVAHSWQKGYSHHLHFNRDPTKVIVSFFFRGLFCANTFAPHAVHMKSKQ